MRSQRQRRVVGRRPPLLERLCGGQAQARTVASTGTLERLKQCRGLGLESRGTAVRILSDSEIDDEVAASQLTSVGIEIDAPTPDQTRAATTW